MRRTLPILLGLLLLGPLAAFGRPPGDDPDTGLVVHEWGTFTSVVGSDGVTLGGVAADAEPLPDFVYERSEVEVMEYAQKMETPVLYFYPERAMNVDVRVDFPHGVLTRWYPRHRATGPEAAADEGTVRNGFLDWGAVRLLPPSRDVQPPEVEPTNHYRHARRVPGAAFVRICDSLFATGAREQGEAEHERFLFYRGLGDFELPVCAHLEKEGSEATLVLRNDGPHDLPGGAVLLYRKDGDDVRTAWLDELAPGGTEASVSLSGDAWSRSSPGEAADRLRERLEGAGLFPDEARAMVETWRETYFGDDGLRAFYVVPPDLVDALLPLTIDPAPDELERVFVARVEIILSFGRGTAVRDVLEATPATGELDAEAVREAARPLGRFAVPAVGRLAADSDDPSVRRRAERAVEVLRGTAD